MVPSYINNNNNNKYSELSSSYTFIMVTIEAFGLFNKAGKTFLVQVGTDVFPPCLMTL